MTTFAHLSDLHLGAFRDPALRAELLARFVAATDLILSAKVDFVIIAGDLFQVNIPEIATVTEVARQLRRLQDAKIRTYIIYGSHDYSPNHASMVDVLAGAGLYQKVVEGEFTTEEGGEPLLRLRPFRDVPTGVTLVGMSGRKTTLERRYFEHLDLPALEQLPGPKVFVFHSGITELRPVGIPESESVPSSLFPKGFDYYAGGHVHQRGVHGLHGAPMVYPGPLLGYDFRDLEAGALQPRGFYLVEIDQGRATPRFVPVPGRDTVVVRQDAEGLSAEAAAGALRAQLEATQVADRIVLVHVAGQLASGRTSDIPWLALQQQLRERGAFAVYVSRSQLRSTIVGRVSIGRSDSSHIEERVLAEYLDGPDPPAPTFRGDAGVSLARQLLEPLCAELQPGEAVAEGEDRKIEAAYQLLVSARDGAAGSPPQQRTLGDQETDSPHAGDEAGGEEE